ncbi:MAG: PQQ-binding-like beta-propeller repeat protein [Pirellulaceae bacterium]
MKRLTFIPGLIAFCLAHFCWGQTNDNALGPDRMLELLTSPQLPPDESSFLPPSREALRPYTAAAKDYRAGNLQDAAVLLGEILASENQQDYLIWTSNTEAPVSLSFIASRLLDEVPQDELEKYQIRFETLAQRELENAISDRNVNAINRVAWRYQRTAAGRSASMLSGNIELSESRAASAIPFFERLTADTLFREEFQPEASVLLAICHQVSGDKASAIKAIRELQKSTTQQKTIRFAGSTRSIPVDDSQIGAWLQEILGEHFLDDRRVTYEWTSAYGNAAGLPRGESGNPLMLARWSTPILTSVAEREVLDMTTRQVQPTIGAHIPSLQPIAFKNQIMVRGHNSVSCLDLFTGDLLWKFPGWDYGQKQINPTTTAQRNQLESLYLANGYAITQRLFRDSLFGQLAVANDHLFFVDNSGFALAGSRTIAIDETSTLDAEEVQLDFNQLRCLSLARSGAIEWTVGGPDSAAPELGNVTFLGVPKPFEDRLYAIVETSQLIQLVVLDQHTGHLIWSQPLARFEPEEYPDYETLPRFFNGLSPAISDGLLVCPSGVGTVIAFRLADRTIQWCHVYNVGSGRKQIDPWADGYDQEASKTQWLDARIVMDGRTIVMTPPDSEELLVLDALNGNEITSADRRIARNDGLYLGGLVRGLACIIGEHQIRCIDVRTSELLWSVVTPDNATPSGRGFIANGILRVPLDNKSLQDIDLQTGNVIANQTVDYSLGNVITHNGHLISLNTDAISCFPLDGPAQRALESNDTQAARKGDVQFIAALLKFHDGDYKGAFQLAKAMWDENPDRTNALHCLKLLEHDQSAIEIRELEACTRYQQSISGIPSSYSMEHGQDVDFSK